MSSSAQMHGMLDLAPKAGLMEGSQIVGSKKEFLHFLLERHYSQPMAKAEMPYGQRQRAGMLMFLTSQLLVKKNVLNLRLKVM